MGNMAWCKDCNEKFPSQWAKDYPTMVEQASNGEGTRWASNARCPKCDFKHANKSFLG